MEANEVKVAAARKLLLLGAVLGGGSLSRKRFRGRDKSLRGKAEPVQPKSAHPPRNGPCPCGSGRKAKKCCLAPPPPDAPGPGPLGAA